MIEEISLWATESLVPTLTIVLDIAPTMGLVRAGEPDRLESEPLDFHVRVRQGFLDLAARAPERYLVLAADGDRSAITASITARIDELLALQTEPT